MRKQTFRDLTNTHNVQEVSLFNSCQGNIINFSAVEEMSQSKVGLI